MFSFEIIDFQQAFVRRIRQRMSIGVMNIATRKLTLEMSGNVEEGMHQLLELSVQKYLQIGSLDLDVHYQNSHNSLFLSSNIFTPFHIYMPVLSHLSLKNKVGFHYLNCLHYMLSLKNFVANRMMKYADRGKVNILNDVHW